MGFQECGCAAAKEDLIWGPFSVAAVRLLQG